MGVFEDVLAQSSRRPDGLPGVLERRRHPRTPTLRSSHTGMTSHLRELELVPAFGLLRLCDDIDILTKNSVDRNIFFESTVLQAAWPRLTNLLAPHGLWMLCLWETTGDSRKMRLFMPVRRNKIGFPRKTVLQVLSNEYMPLGTPMIDKDCADESVETLLRLLSDQSMKLPGVIDFSHLRADSQTLEILIRSANNLGLKSKKNMEYTRAGLTKTAGDHEPQLSKKRLRELARQQRKLGELGVLEFEQARQLEDILDAFERFMTLELKGWKGRGGTALYNHKKIAAFSRQIVASLAVKGHCEIHSMTLNGETIAAAILLGYRGHYMPWKIAFDETMAPYSPGMQLMVHLTEQLQNRKTFSEADSLAIPNHWMMNRVWNSRVPIVDLSISVAPRFDDALEKLVASKQRLATLKQSVKTLIAKSVTLLKKRKLQN